MLIYIISPYNHRDRIVRTARFKANAEFAEGMLLQGQEAFSEVAYIHAILEANPQLTYDNFNWDKILKPIRKAADKIIAYQLPGWKEDQNFLRTYNQFVGWGEDVHIQGAYVNHTTGKYKEVWDNFGLD